MTKHYLVTGGTGFIGTAIVRRLVSDGHFVTIIDNDFRGISNRLKGLPIEFIRGDIREPKLVEMACEGVDSVIHLAYINGTEHFYNIPEFVLDVGVKGIINVIDGCIKNNVRELIVASSSEVYQTPPHIPTDESVPLSVPDPLNPRYSYGGGKIITELLALNYGRKYFDRVVIFRPHNVYGEDMGWEHVVPQLIQKISKSSEIQIQGSGKETRSFVYIDDLVDGIVLLLEKGEHMNIYNIGTMDEIAIEHLAIEIGRCFDKKITIIPSELPKGGTMRRCPDISKIRKLGYEPKTTLPIGLRKTVEWYKRNL